MTSHERLQRLGLLEIEPEHRYVVPPGLLIFTQEDYRAAQTAEYNCGYWKGFYVAVCWALGAGIVVGLYFLV